MMTRVLMGAVAALAVAASASAATLNLNFGGVNPVVAVNYSQNGGTSWTGTQAGIFNWTQVGTGTPFKTFCTELAQNVTNPTLFTVTSNIASIPVPGGGMGAVRAGLVNTLFSLNFYSATVAGANANIRAAAFQAAIWELVHNSGINSYTDVTAANLSVTSGSFQIQNGDATVAQVQALANAYLLSVVTQIAQDGSNVLNFASLRGLYAAGAQDQLLVVPVPAPALLAGLGLIGAVALRRRITKA